MLGNSVFIKKTAQSKQSPIGRKFAQSGPVGVFAKLFYAKIIKNQCYDPFLEKKVITTKIFTIGKYKCKNCSIKSGQNRRKPKT
jgi:hypothetical protein